MTPERRFLVVDDDPDVLLAARLALTGAGHQADTSAGPEAVAPNAGDYDAVLLDMNFSPGRRTGEEGLGALAQIQAADPALAVVFMTTYGGVSLAVEALKQGAADFVLKPWRNEQLVRILTGAADLTSQRRAGSGFNLEEAERRLVARALETFDGNVSRAAAALGITRPALYRRMERHGLGGD